MFKTAIKHYIYEFCIELIFNKIQANFNVNRAKKFPKVGEFYSRISHKHDDESYVNCIVNNIEKRKNKDGKNYFIIYVKYEYTAGDIFSDDNWAQDTLNEFFDEQDEDFFDELDELDEGDVEVNDNDDDGTGEIESIDTGGYLRFNYKHYNFYR